MWGIGPETSTVGGAIHHAWIYLLVCLLGLLLAMPRFTLRVRLAAALPAAAIGLQAGLFFMAPSAQWRFQLLTVYAAMIVVVFAVRLAIEAGAAREATFRAPGSSTRASTEESLSIARCESVLLRNRETVAEQWRVRARLAPWSSRATGARRGSAAS